MKLSKAKARRIVREVAQDSSRAEFVEHAERRMRQRRITRTRVMRCLKRGDIVQGPAWDEEHCC